jgi:class 3 adenylate cyclase
MEIRRAALVLVDIGSQHSLPTYREADLVHAEDNKARLLESVIDAARAPLSLNKLEGSGAFLYAVSESDLATAQNINAQLPMLFDAFQAGRQTLIAGRQCQCPACLNLHLLRLKVVLHFGETVFKQVRQFKELAGEPVILAHRLNQSTASSPANVIMSEAFYRLSGGLPGHHVRKQMETAKGLGDVPMWVYEFD